MHGRMSEPAMGPYPPRDALALCTSPNLSAIGQRRWGFHTVRGGVDSGEYRFRSWGVEVCSDTEGFLSGAWGPILPELRSLHAPHPISDRPEGLGFSHRVGRKNSIFVPGV